MSDIYLSLTETPSVVTLSQPVVSGVLNSTVTVANVVSVNVVTMPAINVQAAAPAVTTVAGSVAVSNFPASQVVSVSNFPASSSVTIANFPAAQVVTGTVALDANSLAALENVTVTVGNVTIGSAVTIAGFSTSSLTPSTVTVANTVTIAGTVTANLSQFKDFSTSGAPTSGIGFGWYDQDDNEFKIITSSNRLPVVLNTEKNFNLAPGSPIEAIEARIGFGNDVDFKTITVTQGLPVQVVGNSVTIGSLPAISGTVTVSSLPASTVTVSSLPVISGTVTVGNSVTIGSLPTLTPQLPRVTFIDGSGSVTTANTAVTVFASSSTRSYLLVQVTTGSAFVNVGATATTVNGISLTAGQGYAWETTIPQGPVSLISTTTSSRYVAKQA